MPVRFQTLPTPRAGVAALRLDGAVARGDHRHFAAAAGELLGAGACADGLVLELTDLHSISEELADEIALLRRRLAEDGAQVVVVGASVVVAWFLRRRLGGQPLRECATVEEAAADIATGGAPPSDAVVTGRDLPAAVRFYRPWDNENYSRTNDIRGAVSRSISDCPEKTHP